jgi:hypothetical protein
MHTPAVNIRANRVVYPFRVERFARNMFAIFMMMMMTISASSAKLPQFRVTNLRFVSCTRVGFALRKVVPYQVLLMLHIILAISIINAKNLMTMEANVISWRRVMVCIVNITCILHPSHVLELQQRINLVALRRQQM